MRHDDPRIEQGNTPGGRRGTRLAAACAVVWAALVPGIAFAQSGLAGTVTDRSGAVLPGVTVEAASPALIEKVRTGVTDDQGRYAIVDLRPGVYTVTFALTGFTTVKQQDIVLPAAFTATIDAQLGVGGVEEVVTVEGGSPTVDLRNTDETLLQDAERQLAGFLDRLAAQEQVAIATRSLARFAPVSFPAEMVSLIETTAHEIGFSCRRLPSGAGHDAQMMARLCPATMIFVPSVGGLSHNVREHTEPAHLEAGAAVLLHSVLRLVE